MRRRNEVARTQQNLAGEEELVEVPGLGGDGFPGKMLLGAAAACFAKTEAKIGVGHEEIEPGGEVAGELVGIDGLEGALVQLLQRDEKAGFSIDDDFFDPAYGAGDDRGFAGHRLEINDAEGLVDGGAAEDGSVGVELDGRRLAHHFLNPDDAGANGLSGSDRGFHLPGDLRGIGRAGAEDDLKAGVHVADRVYEVDDPFLPRDAADEEDVGDGWIDAVAGERLVVGHGLVLAGVDAVVDDMDAVRVDVEQALDIDRGLARDGDDRVGHFHGGALDPAGEIVAAAELLAFPGAEGLQGVAGDDEGNAVVQLCKNAAEMGVPGVAVDDVCIDVERVEIGAAADGGKDGVEILGSGPGGGISGHTADAEMGEGFVLGAEAADFNVDELRKLAGKIIHVDAGAAVDIGRILVGEEEGFHPLGEMFRCDGRGFIGRDKGRIQWIAGGNAFAKLRLRPACGPLLYPRLPAGGGYFDSQSFRKIGMIRMARMLTTLIMGLIAGPAVSL